MQEYIINKIDVGQLVIGRKDSAVIWQKANINKDFTYPWETGQDPQTIFRALHDGQHLFFRFDVICDSVLTYVNKNHKMEVVDSDRVEIFFRKDNKLNPYYCLEMDSKARIMDNSTQYYRKFDYEWQWPKNGLRIETQITETGYILEGTISSKSLNDLQLINGDIIEAGLYRAHCTKLPVKDKEAEFKWISWVKPDSKEPEFHIPSSFGRLILQR